jgi:hypothetical protein
VKTTVKCGPEWNAQNRKHRSTLDFSGAQCHQNQRIAGFSPRDHDLILFCFAFRQRLVPQGPYCLCLKDGRNIPIMPLPVNPVPLIKLRGKNWPKLLFFWR